jgi:hypothetical protein
MTITQRYRPGRIFSRPLETVSAVARSMLRYLDALGLYAGDRLVDLLSRQQLIRAPADGANPGTQSVEREVVGTVSTCDPRSVDGSTAAGGR